MGFIKKEKVSNGIQNGNHSKKYGHQDSFAERDHYRGEPKSLAKTENMISMKD